MESLFSLFITLLIIFISCTEQEIVRQGFAMEIMANCKPFTTSSAKYIKSSLVQCQHECLLRENCAEFAVKKDDRSTYECHFYRESTRQCAPAVGWSIYKQMKFQDNKKDTKGKEGNRRFVINANSLSDYVKFSLASINEFAAFTICLKVTTEKDNGAFFAYSASATSCDQILITNKKVTVLGKQMNVERKIALNVEQHLCIIWDKQASTMKLYNNGHLREEKNLNYYGNIQGGGYVILGQGYGPGNGAKKCLNYDQKKEFTGKISMVEMWSKKLTSDAIRSIYEESNSDQPDMITWNDFLDNAEIHGQVRREG